MVNDNLIQIHGLNWNPNAVEVLKGLSLDLRQGGFYGIVGPNGSGKTSLLRHIMRILEPERGSIMLERKDIIDYKRRELGQEIALMPQNTAVNVNYTSEEIVMMGRFPYLKPFSGETDADRAAVRQAMEQTNSWVLRDKKFSTLSGGEAQRVIAARAIAQNTPVIALDEPVAHLDIRHQQELMENMRRLNEAEGKTIIAVLHDLNLAISYCDELVLMNEGRVLVQGATEDVLSKENLKAVYGIDFYRLRHPASGKLYLIPE